MPNEFHVGFFAKNYELDKAMRNQSYIFRETLNIDKAEMDKLTALSNEEKMQFIKNELSLSVFIDYQKCEIKSLKFTESGIDVLFASQHAQEEKCHNIEIAFGIPQLKGHSEFLVSINEPTYSPIIQLSYPEHTINVNAYSFMNDGDDSLIENAIHTIGGYEFCIQDKWIYPMSGIVFVIDYDVR